MMLYCTALWQLALCVGFSISLSSVRQYNRYFIDTGTSHVVDEFIYMSDEDCALNCALINCMGYTRDATGHCVMYCDVDKEAQGLATVWIERKWN